MYIVHRKKKQFRSKNGLDLLIFSMLPPLYRDHQHIPNCLEGWAHCLRRKAEWIGIYCSGCMGMTKWRWKSQYWCGFRQSWLGYSVVLNKQIHVATTHISLTNICKQRGIVYKHTSDVFTSCCWWYVCVENKRYMYCVHIYMNFA